MLTKRIIPCLDVKDGKVVKGVNFKNLKFAGNPVNLAKMYDVQGADEIVYLDISASPQGRKTMINVVKETAEQVFIPLTVGGGINELRDIRKILKAGADKISINTAAVKTPNIIKEGSQKFGSQCIVTAIDVKRNYTLKKDKICVDVSNGKCWFEAYTYGGRESTGKDAIEWAKQVEKLGSGEILLTSMDADGTKKGFDLALTERISNEINIPIIASGGAGGIEHIHEVLTKGKADAALAASIFHFKKYTVGDIKEYLAKKGVTIRI